METNNKLREALDDATGLLESISEAFSRGTGGVYMSDVAEAIDNARAALSVPLRNCEVGTAEEQAERYRNFADRYVPCAYRGYARCAEDCPVNIKLTQEGCGELLCQLEWAQMPYEEGGAPCK